MRCALNVMLTLLLPLVVAPSWIVISLESAVKNSDLIVVGTLSNVSEETRGGIDYGEGEITVDEVLRGDVPPRQTLSLVWQNESNVLCPRVEHRGHQGKRAIWLLTLKPEGKVAADNPGRVAPVEKREKVLKLLREAGESDKRVRPTPRHGAFHACCSGARVMPGVR